MNQDNLNQLKEKLSIMQWLFNKGLECDYYYDIEESHGTFLMKKDYVEDKLPALINHQLFPWFCLERVLHLLPNVLRGEDGNKIGELEMHDTRDGFIFWYASESPQLFKSLEGYDEDPHMSALKLLKLVIEGYDK